MILQYSGDVVVRGRMIAKMVDEIVVDWYWIADRITDGDDSTEGMAIRPTY